MVKGSRTMHKYFQMDNSWGSLQCCLSPQLPSLPNTLSPNLKMSVLLLHMDRQDSWARPTPVSPRSVGQAASCPLPALQEGTPAAGNCWSPHLFFWISHQLEGQVIKKSLPLESESQKLQMLSTGVSSTQTTGADRQSSSYQIWCKTCIFHTLRSLLFKTKERNSIPVNGIRVWYREYSHVPKNTSDFQW